MTQLFGRSAAILTLFPPNDRPQTEQIKEALEEKEGIPPAQQRLIFLGKNM
jgi:hypothetical protein